MNVSLLSVEQVAQVLQVTPRTVRNLITRGRFPDAYKIDPEAKRSDWRIPQQNLADFLQKQQPTKIVEH
ncbi:MAG: hypothetical protein CVU39_06305 [Chloroflexi bacterium HGW-Chloroflexi-10]|nr:MAG: hypothetical protein CVU39_06305 [Chloroflexi bacterium HGW-Chloroflexi-10]